jgi:hypothetical protein
VGVELDSDPEVMRYLTGRPSTRDEVEAQHARRLAAAKKVDGLGYWVGLVDDEFVGWWMLQPAHGPDEPDDRPSPISAIGCSLATGARGSRRRARRSCALRVRRRRPRQDHRPDVGCRRRLAGRDGPDRPHVRAHLPTSMSGPVEGREEGEVEFELTREEWNRRRGKIGRADPG